MVILVDTREQLPYWSGHECARIKLNVGDYTTPAFLNHLHIERKSAMDWYGTISQNYRRFRNEIVRALEAGTRLIVLVETTDKNFYAKKFTRFKLDRSEASLREQVRTLQRKYGLEIIWCRNRETAKQRCYEILRHTA
jgi:ERCC4-type nuclease